MNKDIRHEFKYALNRFQARLIESFIRKIGLKEDEASKSEPYTVTSLYFDTPALGDYYDKLAGLKHRRKLRARIYGAHFEGYNGKTWLEIKEKHDMNIHKKRHAILPELWKEFSSKDAMNFFSGESLEKSDFLKEFAYLYWLKGYKPHIVVRYKRKAYVDRFFSLNRLTFDSDLEACQWQDFKYNNAIMTPVQKHIVVMEVKFQKAMPWWFKEMVSRFSLSRQAFSKYTTAVDIINHLNPMPR